MDLQEQARRQVQELTGVAIRVARPDEARTLTEIAFRSKASHGYDQAFMEACRKELTVSLEDFVRRRFWVAEDGDKRLLGFAGLWPVENGIAEVDPIYVDPPYKGMRVGLVLWERLEAQARADRAAKLGLDSDPHAVGFYVRMGCRVVGEAPSGSIPGRMLPRLEKFLG